MHKPNMYNSIIHMYNSPTDICNSTIHMYNSPTGQSPQWPFLSVEGELFEVTIVKPLTEIDGTKLHYASVLHIITKHIIAFTNNS